MMQQTTGSTLKRIGWLLAASITLLVQPHVIYAAGSSNDDPTSTEESKGKADEPIRTHEWLYHGSMDRSGITAILVIDAAFMTLVSPPTSFVDQTLKQTYSTIGTTTAFGFHVGFGANFNPYVTFQWFGIGVAGGSGTFTQATLPDAEIIIHGAIGRLGLELGAGGGYAYLQMGKPNETASNAARLGGRATIRAAFACIVSGYVSGGAYGMVGDLVSPVVQGAIMIGVSLNDGCDHGD